MMMVLAAALGVGGSTILGSILGFSFKKVSSKHTDIIMSFAAGVMLAAAIVGLVLPSLEYGGEWAPLVTVVGIFAGAMIINIIDRIIPYIEKYMGVRNEKGGENRTKKALLLVLAIAIHNFPEGLATGLSFGSGDIMAAVAVSIGIAVQNIPEGMVVVAPMLASGMSGRRAFVYAMITGIVEIIGTFIGYFAVAISAKVVPFALSFAGGTMIYVISEEMIPQAHCAEGSRAPAYSLLIGFCIMIVMNFYM
jgi:ZIP family zinc transporter